MLASITPNSGIRGTSFYITLSGSGLQSPSSLSLGPDITVTNLAAVVGDPTSATATITISATAPLTTRNVTFTGVNGTSTLTGGFTVVAPSVIAISPTADVHGNTGTLVIAGTGLFGSTAVNLGSGVTVSGITVTPDGTQLTATYIIATTAPLGTSDVQVTTPGGLTPINTAVTFTVK